jgi:hypothetical protein
MCLPGLLFVMFNRNLSVESNDLFSRYLGTEITSGFLTHTEVHDNKN